MAVIKVLIVEPFGTGHHMALYVRHVAKSLLAAGVELTLLTTSSAIASPGFSLVKSTCDDLIQLRLMSEPIVSARTDALFLSHAQIHNWFALRKRFKELLTELQPDIVYVPTLDWIAKAVELFGSPFRTTPFVPLYMAPKHHRWTMGIGPACRSDGLYEWLFRRLLSINTMPKVLVIDVVFYEYCVARYGRQTKIEYVPDFGELVGISSPEECRANLGVSELKTVVLVYGFICNRKGITELIEAAADDRCPADLVLILAGSASSDVSESLKGPSAQRLSAAGRLILRLHFHNDSEEYMVFKASDYVWLGYIEGFLGSSGVLNQAAIAGKPVLAMRQGLIGVNVERYRLGIMFDSHRRDELIQALCQAVKKKTELPLENLSCQEFARNHSSEKHSSVVKTTLIEEIRRREK